MFKLLTFLSIIGFLSSLFLWGLGHETGLATGIFLLATFGFACMEVSSKLQR